MRQLIAIVGWLVVGHAVAGGLFWALLLVPESNALMVVLSACLAVLVLVVTAEVETIAVMSWIGPDGRRARVGRAVRALPACLAALVFFLGIYWLTGTVEGWLGDHRGEIDAWLILHARIVKSGAVHAAAGWTLWFVRFGIGVSLALALLVALVESGPRALAGARWLRQGLGARRLALIVLWLLALVWAPWQLVYWRPTALPPSWLEPAFVTVKLALIYLAASLGWALVLKTGTRAIGRRAS
jgi:hypothetical protein